MAQMILEMSEQAAKLLKNKKFLEIVTRNSKKQFKDFIKVVQVAAKPENKDAIDNVIRNFIKNEKLLNVADPDFIRSLKPADVRKILAHDSNNIQAMKNQIEQLSSDAKNIFSGLASVQSLSWLNVALSAANLTATVVSAVIICKKLDNIAAKLDQINNKIDKLLDVNFMQEIGTPCKAMLMDYKKILDDIERGKNITEDDMISLIRQYHNMLDQLLDIQKKYPDEHLFTLVYDMLPPYTNLIALFYQRYYDDIKREYVLHSDWMHIYDRLDEESFQNDIRDYLAIEEHRRNKEINEIMDCQRLVNAGLRHKITEVLEDLQTCGNTQTYKDIFEFSRQYAQQQAKVFEAEMELQMGADAASSVMEVVKPQYAYMEI